MNAINHALSCLAWMEMRDEDRPPRDIWISQTAIGEHFGRLKEKYASDSGTDEVVDLDQNELTKGLR